jgi:hypothetical protein
MSLLLIVVSVLFILYFNKSHSESEDARYGNIHSATTRSRAISCRNEFARM